MVKCPRCGTEFFGDKCPVCGYEPTEYDRAIETLMSLTGVGRKRAEELYRAGFTDIEKISGSSEDDLIKVKGIGRELAKKIKKDAEKLSETEEQPSGITICPVCGAVIPANLDRCPRCGTPLKKEESEKLEHAEEEKEVEKKKEELVASKESEISIGDVVVCPNCGALVPKGSTVCPVCGSDLQNVRLEEPKPLEDPAEVLKRVFGISELPSEKAEEEENVDIRICPNCGAIVVNRDTCPVCGAPVPKVEAKLVDEEINLSEKLRVCPNCGAFVPPSVDICPVCGTPLEEEEVEEEEEAGISLADLRNIVAPQMPQEEVGVEELKESGEADEIGVEELKEIENVVEEVPQEQVIDEGALNDILSSLQPVEEEIGIGELEEIGRSVKELETIEPEERAFVREKVSKEEKPTLEKPKPTLTDKINTLFSGFGTRQDIVSFAPFFASFIYFLSLGFLYGEQIRILYLSTGLFMAIITIMSVVEIYLSMKDMRLHSHFLGAASLLSSLVFLYPLYVSYLLFIIFLFFLVFHYRYSVNYWITIAFYSVMFIIFPSFISGIVVALGFGFIMHIYWRYREISPMGHKAIKRIENFYSEGLRAFVEKRYHEAIYLLRKALETKPDDKLALNTLGLAYARIGNDDMALETFKKIVRMDPRYKYAWNNMGNVYARIGDYEKAVKCYRNALKIDPDYDDSLLNLGYVMIRMGSYNEALKLAEKIKAIS